MNCPNCGHEIKADINYSKALANAINERLTHYGHTKEMNPKTEDFFNRKFRK